MKIAVITGITGQDGAYLAELLLSKGYRVVGAYRRSSTTYFWRLEELGLQDHPNLHLVEFDITDPSSCMRLIQNHQPQEVYNLAAQSFVRVSFDQPTTTGKINGMGVLNLLEAIRMVNPAIRFYQASTSEMFGKAEAVPQDEWTPFHPRSPYAVSKLFAHWLCINYWESYGIFCCRGILFNHESPLRGKEFVTRKITDGLARIKLGLQDQLALGNLNATRDWGYAREYVAGMWLMMQQEQPDSFVLATQRAESVRSFVTMAAKGLGIHLSWQGEGLQEVGVDEEDGRAIIRIDPRYFRPAEVDNLLGNPAHAKRQLGWQATTSLEELCRMMVEADRARIERGFAF
ncbi:MAG: GDP-mannose 4,6-dehydratase [Magnetococcales bacterium]|nr:GDP-mannose 4,6-dehydratase [Magnetococcales bacterium]NGZ25703.1 GDP-mannose 4,6-dehydratase [Magnetococcales bacterium]